MARRPYVHLAGDLSTWPKGFTPTPAHMRKLDQFSSELVNGDEGGTYAPSDPIVVGPWGTTPNITLSSAGSVLSGDVETVRGNSRDTTLDGPGLVMQGGNPPIFQTARTRSIVVPFVVFMEHGGAVSDNRGYALDVVRCGAKQTVLAAPIFTVPLPLRAQHRGATITSVDFSYVIAQQRTSLPGIMPTVRVIKCTADVAAALHTVAAPYITDGWLPDQAATADAYFNNGNPRTTTYTPNQNNTAIDPTTSFWALQLYGEADPNGKIGDVFLSATVHLSTIADMRQE